MGKGDRYIPKRGFCKPGGKKRHRLGNYVDGVSVDVARRVDTLGEFLPGFLLGRRQRVVTHAAHAIVRGLRLTGEPVLREFGRESVHDVYVVVSVIPLTLSNSCATEHCPCGTSDPTLPFTYDNRVYRHAIC